MARVSENLPCPVLVNVRLGEEAARAVGGYHGKLAILRLPNDEEIDRIRAWLGTLNSTKEARLEDLAVFYADALESATSSRVVAQLT